MFREKNGKKLFNLGLAVPCLLLLFSIIAFPSKVEAKSIWADEMESNDTRQQAQEIQENKSTPEGFYHTAIDGTYQMNGSTSTTDEDWFKVFMTQGLKYFTCGEKPFIYTVEDQAGNIVTEGAYNSAERVFTFEIPANGTYYVRIKGISAEQTKYLFYVGGPVWGVGSVVIPCNPTTISMTGGSKTGFFDATNLNIPKDAVVTSLNFNNVRTTSVKSIMMNNINMTQYSWSADDLETQHLPAAVIWKATFGYSKTIKFNPTVKMYYLYPKHN